MEEANMKYGESTFDILYLLFAITTGIIILVKRKDSIGKLMGIAALVLGCGDARHADASEDGLLYARAGNFLKRNI